MNACRSAMKLFHDNSFVFKLCKVIQASQIKLRKFEKSFPLTTSVLNTSFAVYVAEILEAFLILLQSSTFCHRNHSSFNFIEICESLSQFLIPFLADLQYI